MRKSFWILFFVLLASNLFAQTNYIPSGVWKYIDGHDTIEFYLKSSQMNVAGTTYPILIGFHKYIKNGQLIESSMGDINTDYSDKKYTILLYNVQENRAKYSGNFKDLSTDVNRLIILTKLTPKNISVRLTSKQVSKNINGIGYTLPRNFTLIRE